MYRREKEAERSLSRSSGSDERRPHANSVGNPTGVDRPERGSMYSSHLGKLSSSLSGEKKTKSEKHIIRARTHQQKRDRMSRRWRHSPHIKSTNSRRELENPSSPPSGRRRECRPNSTGPSIVSTIFHHLIDYCSTLYVFGRTDKGVSFGSTM
jgi:hypothetical protein